MKIKTRFAPSPTGHLHVGSARTALYSWLFARAHNLGRFILRIEDTDLERSTQSSIHTIMDSMNWLNLDWDEGPYFQTKRFDRYNTVIDKMLSYDTAYKCYCSKERLEKLRKVQMNRGEKPRYDGFCRNSHHHVTNEPFVVRFNNPKEGSVVFNDLVRGPIEFNNQELDDMIIRRTNGSPTYNFCVVIDDYDMAITHVIRGEDHINNTPRQINIFKALGVPIPEYAHIPMILGDDGKKLSKRYDAMGIMQYRDDGFLPEAVLNHLVRLGWSHGDQEIFSIDEMKQLFSLDAVSKSASVFNTEKLLWFNHHYINHLPADYVATHLVWHMKEQGIDIRTGPQLAKLVKLLGKRYKTLKEIAANCRYFYEEFREFDISSAKKYLCLTATPALQLVRTKLEMLDEWTPTSIRAEIKKTAKELQVNMGKVGMPLRVAVTGSDQSPSIDLTVHAIGQSRSLARIDLALNFIAQRKK